MREKPILFNTEMVRAILDGRKTVTRRAVKPQPISKLAYCMGYKHGTWGYPDKESWKYWDDESFRLPVGLPDTEKNKSWTPPCRTGDILYVRETWAAWSRTMGTPPVLYYRADLDNPDGIKWTPSIHMPREAARIFLRVTGVRVERLQDMTINDSLREGVKLNAKECVAGKPPLDPFARLWDSTIKPADRALYGWDANPWVWVITFKRIPQDGGNSK